MEDGDVTEVYSKQRMGVEWKAGLEANWGTLKTNFLRGLGGEPESRRIEEGCLGGRPQGGGCTGRVLRGQNQRFQALN